MSFNSSILLSTNTQSLLTFGTTLRVSSNQKLIKVRRLDAGEKKRKIHQSAFNYARDVRVGRGKEVTEKSNTSKIK